MTYISSPTGIVPTGFVRREFSTEDHGDVTTDPADTYFSTSGSNSSSPPQAEDLKSARVSALPPVEPVTGEAEVVAGDSPDEQVWVPSSGAVLVKTPSTKATMAKLGSAVASEEFVLITGETGAGKTAAVEFMAHLLNRPIRRVYGPHPGGRPPKPVLRLIKTSSLSATKTWKWISRLTEMCQT